MPITSPLVLVVEDSADARTVYGEHLERYGFRVMTAGNGVEALAAAREDWPAVILMDLVMPLMDRWEAIRRLRADPLTTDIPIIALSAHAFGDPRLGARSGGADLCMSKPCRPAQVARVVRAMLGSSRDCSS